MTKKEALMKLKSMFRNPTLPTHKLKLVRDLYSEIKDLKTIDDANIPKDLEFRVASLY